MRLVLAGLFSGQGCGIKKHNFIINKDIEVKEADIMSILEVTEDKIFQTLGKGRDPKFKHSVKTRTIEATEPFDYTSLLK